MKLENKKVRLGSSSGLWESNLGLLVSSWVTWASSSDLWASNSERWGSNWAMLANTEDLWAILRMDWSGSSWGCWGSAVMATWGRMWGSWGSSWGSLPRVRGRGCRETWRGSRARGLAAGTRRG